jgi:hypothetical protein
MQVISFSGVLPAVPNFHGQTANSNVDHTGVLHQRMDSFDVPATLLVLANKGQLVSTSGRHIRSSY